MATILITGGSDGLGKALARALAGVHKVVILARSEEETKAAAAEIGCDYAIADVADAAACEHAVEEVVKKHGAIDVLVNNAGIWIQGPLEENDPARIQEVMRVNTEGTMLMTRFVLPHMRQAGQGLIVNVISQAGLAAKKERSVYHASKWAITGFTKSLQQEYAGTGIRVSGFYPGPMQTKLFAKVGIEKDLSKALTLDAAVRALQFIIDTPADASIPELGLNPVYY